MEIPESEGDCKRRAFEKRNAKPVINSFYISGTGKTSAEYVENAANRRAAGIIQRKQKE